MTDPRPAVRTVDTPPADTDADVLVLGVRQHGSGAAVLDGTDLPEQGVRGLEETLATVGASGSTDEVTRLPSPQGVAAASVLAVGVGRRDPADPETLRRAAGTAARSLAGVSSAVLALPAADPGQASAALEGALMGAYAFTAFRSTSSNGKAPLAEVVVRDAEALAAARASAVAAGVARARDWINTPPGDLPPAVFAEQIVTAAQAAGVSTEVLDEQALAEGGYGGIVGVGRGSVNPPRLVRLAYRPEGARGHLAVVGKGITFDSGGLSLKPAEAMVGMKTDMSGAAAAVAAVLAVAELGVPVDVTVYAALAENMPSGSASRPQDVLRMYGGRTVEVLNTDAEGRLVMADALVRAAEDGPDLLVDIATLTGACVVALGNRVAGLMTNDPAATEQVRRAAQAAGEEVWPLPIPEETRGKLDSAVADIANVGNRFGGALQAAAFLREFVADGLAWAHLDIAGPARNTDSPYGYTPKGGTGFGVRTLVALAERLD